MLGTSGEENKTQTEAILGLEMLEGNTAISIHWDSVSFWSV